MVEEYIPQPMRAITRLDTGSNATYQGAYEVVRQSGQIEAVSYDAFTEKVSLITDILDRVPNEDWGQAVILRHNEDGSQMVLYRWSNRRWIRETRS